MLEMHVGKFLWQAIFNVCRLCARGVATGSIVCVAHVCLSDVFCFQSLMMRAVPTHDV